jgi:hypothetical protein
VHLVSVPGFADYLVGPGDGQLRFLDSLGQKPFHGINLSLQIPGYGIEVTCGNAELHQIAFLKAAAFLPLFRISA